MSMITTCTTSLATQFDSITGKALNITFPELSGTWTRHTYISESYNRDSHNYAFYWHIFTVQYALKTHVKNSSWAPEQITTSFGVTRQGNNTSRMMRASCVITNCAELFIFFNWRLMGQRSPGHGIRVVVFRLTPWLKTIPHMIRS